jgi:hypothetical protein
LKLYKNPFFSLKRPQKWRESIRAIFFSPSELPPCRPASADYSLISSERGST